MQVWLAFKKTVGGKVLWWSVLNRWTLEPGEARLVSDDSSIQRLAQEHKHELDQFNVTLCETPLSMNRRHRELQGVA